MQFVGEHKLQRLPTLDTAPLIDLLQIDKPFAQVVAGVSSLVGLPDPLHVLQHPLQEVVTEEVVEGAQAGIRDVGEVDVQAVVLAVAVDEGGDVVVPIRVDGQLVRIPAIVQRRVEQDDVLDGVDLRGSADGGERCWVGDLRREAFPLELRPRKLLG